MKTRGCRISPAYALFIMIAAMGAVTTHAQATPQSVHIHLDPATTEIHFILKDTLHTVKGTFRLKSGDVTVNAATGEAQGLIAVDVDSGASGNDSRDGRMKRDLLETAKYPLATFEPQKVTGFSASATTQTISVAGNFTLHGAAHPMTLQFAVTQNGASPAATTAATSFKIPYVAWGIKDPSIPFVHVEKEVTIDIAAKGTLQ